MSKKEIEKRIAELYFRFKADPNGPQAYTRLAEISRLGKERKNAK